MKGENYEPEPKMCYDRLRDETGGSRVLGRNVGPLVLRGQEGVNKVSVSKTKS
jgi:hypothetical protein